MVQRGQHQHRKPEVMTCSRPPAPNSQTGEENHSSYFSLLPFLSFHFFQLSLLPSDSLSLTPISQPTCPLPVYHSRTDLLSFSLPLFLVPFFLFAGSVPSVGTLNVNFPPGLSSSSSSRSIAIEKCRLKNARLNRRHTIHATVYRKT